MNKEEYTSHLESYSEEFGIPMKELEKLFPYADYKTESDVSLDCDIDSYINLMDEKDKGEENRTSVYEKDEPLHDWDRYFQNFGTMNGY